MARISKNLKGLKENLELEDFIEETEIENYDFHLLIDELNEKAFYLEDYRNFHLIIHSIEGIIITVILALFANCNTFVEVHLFAKKHFEWLKEQIEFAHGLPSLSTFKRVISMINPKELEDMCNEIFFEFVKKKQKYIYKKDKLKVRDITALDGKTANQSGRTTLDENISKTNAMSAYSVKNEKCLATEFINGKTNEIPTGPILLSRLNIKEVVVTFDALNTQKETINYIVSKKGYYVAPVKDNHGNLYKDLIDYFADEDFLKKATKYIEKETAHNQLEERIYIFTNNIDWLEEKNDWKDLKSIGVVIKKIDDVEKERRYFISNIEENHTEFIGNVIRKEWSIENKLHWYLDMTFQEDKNKCYIENSQKNLNIIRKFCLGILKVVKDEYKLSMNLIRLQLSMDFENEIKHLIDLL